MSEKQQDSTVSYTWRPSVPTTKDGLLFEALATVERMSSLLNDLAAQIYALDESEQDGRIAPLHALLLRRFSDCSGVHLFIAASNIGLELPADMFPPKLEDEPE